MQSILGKLLSRTHIETYILIFIPLLSLALWLLIDPSLFSQVLGTTSTELLYYLFFGWDYLQVAMGIVYIYATIKCISFAIHKARTSKNHPNHQTTTRSDRTIVSFGYILATLLCALVATMLFTQIVFMPDPARVASASYLLTQADYTIFGAYVPLAIQSFPYPAWLAHTLLWSYINLSLVFSLVTLLVLIKSKRMFRQLIMGFILIPILSLPFWLWYPAIPPAEMYQANKLNLAYPPVLSSYIHTHLDRINPQLKTLLTRIEPYETQPQFGLYDTTSFPSMHIAWATLIVYAAATVEPLTLIALVPWWAFNALGAIYTMQHYAVDALGGVAISILAIVIVRALYRLEKRHRRKDAADQYTAVDVFQRDVQHLWTWLRSCGHVIVLRSRSALKKYTSRLDSK